MLTVAIEGRVNRVEEIRQGVTGALASMLVKDGANQFNRAVSEIRKSIRESQKAARGLPAQTEAERFTDIMKGLGLREGRPRRRKHGR